MTAARRCYIHGLVLIDTDDDRASCPAGHTTSSFDVVDLDTGKVLHRVRAASSAPLPGPRPTGCSVEIPADEPTRWTAPLNARADIARASRHRGSLE